MFLLVGFNQLEVYTLFFADLPTFPNPSSQLQQSSLHWEDLEYSQHRWVFNINPTIRAINKARSAAYCKSIHTWKPLMIIVMNGVRAFFRCLFKPPKWRTMRFQVSTTTKDIHNSIGKKRTHTN